MIRRVLAVGLLAGLVAGLAMAALQHVTTVPLIIQAEVYETAADGAHASMHGDTATMPAGHDHAAMAAAPTDAAPSEHEGHGDGWKPADGWERTLSTLAATLVTSIGFALLLIAAMLVDGAAITPMAGLAWACGGFAAVNLATGLGLAPELPGSAAGDLTDRQIWWVGTALATAAGLYLLLKTPKALSRGVALPVGTLLLLAPHVIGAPEPTSFASTVPAELAARFTATSLATGAVLWMLMGLAVGWFWRLSAEKA